MCFSAEASFIGGAVLTTIGILSVRKNNEPSQRLLATMPLVFGLQQISEGFVWIALKSTGHDLLLKVAAYVFLTAALLIWPTFVPLSIRLMEFDPLRRKILNVLTAIGLLTSLSYLAGMLSYAMTVQISSLHISYGAVDAPQLWIKVAYFAYLAATLLPFFVTSKRRVYLLGAVIVVAYAVAAYFYSEYLLSVWCFFAAVTSVVVWWIVGEVHIKSKQPVRANP